MSEGQSYIRERLIESAKREVELPESELVVRIQRARPYRMIGGRAVPIGTLIQNLSKITWKAAKGEDITDEEAGALNEDTPSSVELCESLLIECVEEMKLGDRAWTPVHIIEDDRPGEPGPDDYSVSDFQRSLTPGDLGVLMHEIFEHNGLGEAIAKMLAPFRAKSRRPPAHDGEGVRMSAH